MKNKFLNWFNSIMAMLIIVGDLLYMLVFRGNLIVKGLTSFIFFVCGLVNLCVMYKNQKINIKKYSIFLTIGLFFAMLGDIILGVDFTIGAGLFALGHIFFFVAFLFLNRFSIWDIIISLITIGISLCIVLLSNGLTFGKMLPLVIAYAVIISNMLAKSFSNLLLNRNYSSKQLLYIFVGTLMFSYLI